jgi:hypothetical protein
MAEYREPQTLTVEGRAFPADKAPKVGDQLDVTIPWTGRGVTVTVMEVEPQLNIGDTTGVVYWIAKAVV